MDQSRPLRVALGSDHGGFLLNEDIKAFLVEMGYQSEGFGTHFHASVNFPNDALLLAKTVSREEYESCFAPPGGVYRNEQGSRRPGGSLYGIVHCGNVTGSYRRKCVVLEWKNYRSASGQAHCKNLTRNRAFKRG
jgi:hypothetical protein